MHKIGLFAAAALILAGVGAWAASTTHTPTSAAAARLDPSQMMVNAKALPVEDFIDYTFVFN
jgi:hypothetical protein